MSEKDNMKKYHGTPEIVAKIAEESDHPSVREKWDELNTLVHLVHKEKVIKKKQQASDLSKTWDEIEHRMRLVKNATKGSGIDYEGYDVDKGFLDGYNPNVTYSFGNDDGTYEWPNPSTQMTLDFPGVDMQPTASSAVNVETVAVSFPKEKPLKLDEMEKHIEENTLSSPLSEYEAIEKLSKDD